MRGLIFILVVIIFAAMINVESIGFLAMLLLGAYAIYTLTDKATPSVQNITKGTSMIDTLQNMNMKVPDGIMDNMVKDFAKVTNAVVNGKEANADSKSIAKASVNMVNNTMPIFK